MDSTFGSFQWRRRRFLLSVWIPEAPVCSFLWIFRFPSGCPSSDSGPFVSGGGSGLRGFCASTVLASVFHLNAPGLPSGGISPGLQGGSRERRPAGEAERRHERVLAQDGLLRGRQTAAEEEEEEDRPQYDRRADKLHPPHTHRIRRDGRRTATVRVSARTDEIERTQHEWQEQPVIAGVYESNELTDLLQTPCTVQSSGGALTPPPEDYL